MSTTIVVIDYGMGNVASILNMLKKVGAAATVSADPAVIDRAAGLILPGVGAFDTGMKNLLERNLVPALQRKVTQARTPVLGICLGMQLLTRRSQEGTLPGLGWIDAETVRLERDPSVWKIPHMGWNTLAVNRAHPLLTGLEEASRFYFVHSYQLNCFDPSDVLAEADYGGAFPAMIARGNIFGTQFHPEKSHRFGMKLLANFAASCALSTEP
jgi:glutamine amidotransferase